MFSKACKICFLIIFFAAVSRAQKFAIVVPSETEQSKTVSKKLSLSLADKLTISPASSSDAVYKTLKPENIFNLSTEEARNFGNALGCDYFLILRAENLRRFSLAKSEYYEGFAAFFLISSRTGRLIGWHLKSFENDSAAKADLQLFASTDEISEKIFSAISLAEKNEFRESIPQIEEVPEADSAEAADFVIPLPYRRIRPLYTPTANLYGVAATVDALVDLDEKGKISRFEIIRWAGFGLDESVEKTVREMQWRPASRDGKSLPIRFLLRYNFRKLD